VARTTGRSTTHLIWRLVQLYVGLTLYGASSALLVRAELGLEPWGVLHQGLAELTGISIGVVSIIIGAVVLLLWIPLRQRPGLGTVSNVFVVGLAMDGTLAVVGDLESLGLRIPVMVLGIVLNGVATGLYIAARFGPGPRDGLMTGLNHVTGRSIRLVRTAIEVAVVATGFVLGGSLGAGTVLYALAIGPLAQFFLRMFSPPAPTEAEVTTASEDTTDEATTAREITAPDGVTTDYDGPSTTAPPAGSGPVAAPASGQAILPQ
jgi:uncharacterized membrane protein YczE